MGLSPLLLPGYIWPTYGVGYPTHAMGRAKIDLFSTSNSNSPCNSLQNEPRLASVRDFLRKIGHILISRFIKKC